MLRFLAKEVGLLFAFVVLGGVLLLCIWASSNVQTSILNDFENSQISVILKPGADELFKEAVDSNENVIGYTIHSEASNKKQLGQVYPELKNVIEPLDAKFFPTSAVIEVRDADKFMAQFAGQTYLYEKQILHKPPVELRQFMDVLTFVFSCLWLLTLTLVLYFNLERLTVREEAKWSLMKMLGSRPIKLFLPLWYGQASRMGIASACAIVIAILTVNQIKSYFAWQWSSITPSVWISFFMISIGMTLLISFSLFIVKYRRVQLG